MNYQLAEDEFREIIRMNPQGAGGHFGLGVALSGGGKLREAEDAYRKATALKPLFAWVFYLQTIVLGLQEREEAAGKDLRSFPKGDKNQCHFQEFRFSRSRASKERKSGQATSREEVEINERRKTCSRTASCSKPGTRNT